MATVQDMIRKKGTEIFMITPSATVLEAMKLMETHNTGAVLVMDGGEVKGILSERDCVRKLELSGKQDRKSVV